MFAGSQDRAGGRAAGRAGRLRRSRLALFATAAACACVGASQAGTPPPTAATKQAPAGRVVSGRVLEAPGGKPAVGTTVSLWHGGSGRTRTTRTDKLGAFRFQDVPRSEYGYVLRVGGLPTGVWSEGAAVRVFKRDVRASELYFKRTQGLSGTVRDAEGRPVAGVGINFSTADAKGNRAAVTTDGKGRFCLYTLPRDVALYCKGTHDRYYPTTGERTLTIRRGEVRTDVDFVVLGAPSFRGRVLRGDGKPAANLTVLAMAHWSRASVQDGRRIAEARKRRDARTQGGREPRRPKLKPHVSPDWGESRFSGGIGKDVRLTTDEQGRFRGYLRRPFDGDRDEAIDVMVVTRLADRSQAGMAIIQTTTLDPPPPTIEVKLRPTGSAVFRVVNPDGKPVAEAKPGCRLELPGRSFGYGIAEVAPVLKALGGGRCRATGLVEGWCYCLHASAEGYRCSSRLRVTAKAGEHVDAGTLRLGWWGPKAVPGLIRGLHSSNRYTREGTCRMLGSLGAVAAPAVGDLVDRLRNDRWNTVRYEAAAALGGIGPEAKGALPDLMAALKDDKLGVPREAAKALGLIGDRRALPALIEALHHKDRDARIEAIGALGRLGDPKALPHLKAALTDGVYHIREAALGALAKPPFRKADPGVAALLRLKPIVRDTGAMEIALPIVTRPGNEPAGGVIERLGAGRLSLKTALRILEVVTDEPFAGRFESPEDLLAWWWQLPLDPPAARGARLDAARMRALWGRLDDEAGPQAYRAMCALAAGGDEVVALVAGRVGPASAEPPQVRRWIGDLDAERYAARARAYDNLSLLGRRVEPALREALKSADSPEAKSRLESLLKALALPYPATPAARRAARAIRVLERIGTPKAAALLRRLAQSAPGSLPAERAKAAIERIRPATDEAATQPAALLPGEPVLRLGPCAAGATSSADGKVLATMNGDEVQFWDVASGKRLEQWRVNQGGMPRALALSPDRRRLVVGNGRVFDTATGKEVRRLARAKLESILHFLAFSADGRVFVCGSNRRACVYDTGSWKLLREFRPAGPALFGEFAMSADAAVLAARPAVPLGIPPPGAEDPAVVLWDVASRKRLRTWKGFRSGIAMSPDGKLLAMASANGDDVELVATGSGKRLRTWRRIGSRLAFSPDGRVLATGRENVVSFWDVSTGRKTGELFGQFGLMGSLAFSPDGKLLIGRFDWRTIVWRLGRARPGKALTSWPSNVRAGLPVNGLTVSISPEKGACAAGEPVRVRWKLKNAGAVSRTIVWDEKPWSPAAFALLDRNGAWSYFQGEGSYRLDDLEAPPRRIALPPGGEWEVTCDLRKMHAAWDASPGDYQLVGFYCPARLLRWKRIEDRSPYKHVARDVISSRPVDLKLRPAKPAVRRRGSQGDSPAPSRAR